MSGRVFTPIEMLERLVSFDTTSRNSNLAIIDFIEDYLASHGVASRRYDHEPGRKTNLYATIGPDDVGGVVLSGHTDVVPVDGQVWTSAPFRLAARDDKLFGRGTCDMKGFIAAVLAMAPEFKARKLRTPIHLALSCDEEIGCRGVQPMIAGLQTDGPKPKLVIVGEPTSMRVVNAHKGTITFLTEVIGAEAHSSDPLKGVNAVTVAAKLVCELDAAAAELRALGDPSGRFRPPYTTLHVGIIEGGTVKNIVPGHCKVTWEMRPLPGTDPQDALQRLDSFAKRLEADMRFVSPKARITTRKLNAVPGLRPLPGTPAEVFVMRLAQTNETYAASYATEAGLFQEGGIPTLICGPGSIDQAHKPDEFIEIDELERCMAFMRRLADACHMDTLF